MPLLEQTVTAQMARAPSCSALWHIFRATDARSVLIQSLDPQWAPLAAQMFKSAPEAALPPQPQTAPAGVDQPTHGLTPLQLHGDGAR